MAYQHQRSSSVGHEGQARSRSPSPHPVGFNSHATGDPSLLAAPPNFGNPFSGNQRAPSPIPYSGTYLAPQTPQNTNFSDPNFSRSQGAQQQYQPEYPPDATSGEYLDPKSGAFGTADTQDLTLDPNQPFDPSLFLDLGPQTDNNNNNGQGPSAEEMTTLHQQPAHLQSFHTYQPSHSSPVFQGESLDPSSAAYGPEWTAIRHRRTPSDQHSDVSSNHASPYIGNGDFEPSMTNDQQGTLFPDMGQISLSDTQLQVPQHISPGHSPLHSPHLQPQNPNHIPQDSFIGPNDYNGGASMFSNQEVFPSIEQPTEHLELGQADQMTPPELRIDYAPPTRQPVFNNERTSLGALSPPIDTHHKPRQRASSAPYSPTTSRPVSPEPRSRSPSLGVPPSHRSRSSSPQPPSGGIVKIRRSSSPGPHERQYLLDLANRPSGTDLSGGVGQRDTSPIPPQRRAQKHPATFQCHLCPKRFTRAYNLRSHLRTHTDERPFVCTVCGKAFARQHDRKRHEGLHSGEKKFVCRGMLAGGQGQWGCGRKFARADALGRHFRSEAGRNCIKPLLDEERAEREAAAIDQQNQDMLNAQQQGKIAIQTPPMGSQMDFAGMPLPAALLQQYPALASIQWNSMPTGGVQGGMGGDQYGDMDDGDFGSGLEENDFGSTRSSFDAGEFDDDGGYVSGPGLDMSYPAQGSWGTVPSHSHNNGWASDVGA